jgi:hypothetical protein
MKLEMALHRDIFWVGRQWAVTGHGIQAVDQKQKGKFDIEASRVWQDDLAEPLRGEGWLNIEDFDKALAVARTRFPQPPGMVAALRQSVSQAKPASPVKEASPAKEASQAKEAPIEQPKPALQRFDMQVEGCSARFVRPWRIRVRR